MVKKRDNRSVQFDSSKIQKAIESACISVDGELTEADKELAKKIADSFDGSIDTTVEDIQDKVEQKLMSSKRKDVAKAYILYRNERSKYRRNHSKMMKVIKEKIDASNVLNQNANVDEKSFGGRRGEAVSELLRDYALDNCMSEMAKNNHLNNEIYIHDLDSYALGCHNCLSIPFDDLLANGFAVRQTDIRPAQSVSTAFQLVAVIFQAQSLQEFGGVSATHIDWTMVPYVRKSFYKHYEEVASFVGLKIDKPDDIGKLSIDDKFYKGEHWWSFKHKRVYKEAMKLTIKEIYQAVEGMYHNLNSLQSRSGNEMVSLI